MKIKRSIVVLVLSLLAGMSFLFMYFLLSFYNRLAFDDFWELAHALKYGWIDGVIGIYRFSDGSVLNSMIYLFVLPILFALNKIYLFNYATVLIIILTLWFFIFSVSKRLKIEFSWIWKLVFSLILTSFLYLTSPSYSHCCYWVSTMILYVYPLVFFVISVSFILLGKNSINYIVGVGFFFLFCLSRVHVVVVPIGLLIVYLTYSFYINRKIDRLLLILSLVGIIGLMIVVLAPGNFSRQKIELDVKNVDVSYIVGFIYAFKKVIMGILIANMRYYVAAFLLFLWVGAQMTMLRSDILLVFNNFLNFGILKLTVISIIFIGGLFVFNTAIMYLAVKQCFYAPRVWTHFFSIFLLAVVMFSLLLGYKLKAYENLLFYFNILSLVFICYVSIRSIQLIQPQNKAYADWCDSNIDLIKRAKFEKRTTVLYLHPRPSNTGLLQDWFLKRDTAYGVNRSIQYNYGLQFPISDSTVELR